MGCACFRSVTGRPGAICSVQNRQRLLEFYSEIVLQNVQERIVVFVDRDVDEELVREPELRRRQAHAFGVVHGFDHVVDQGLGLFARDLSLA